MRISQSISPLLVILPILAAAWDNSNRTIGFIGISKYDDPDTEPYAIQLVTDLPFWSCFSEHDCEIVKTGQTLKCSSFGFSYMINESVQRFLGDNKYTVAFKLDDAKFDQVSLLTISPKRGPQNIQTLPVIQGPRLPPAPNPYYPFYAFCLKGECTTQQYADIIHDLCDPPPLIG